MGSFLFFIQFLYMTIAALTRASSCFPQFTLIHAKFTSVSGGLYAFQYCIILLFLFFRLYYVFEQTSFRLSKCTICTFVSLYIILIILMIGCVVLYSTKFYFESNHWVSWIMPAGFGMNTSLLGFLEFLFIYKLIVVNKLQSQQNNMGKQVNTITKLSLLGFSLCSSFLTALIVILVPFLPFNGEYHAKFMIGFFCITDTMINFVAILFTFHYFHNSYTKACGCCDIKCKALCKGILTEPLATAEEEVQLSPKSREKLDQTPDL